MEIPDQWKMDELKRLLDPKQDNRKVNMEEFVEVGRAWYKMISTLGKTRIQFEYINYYQSNATC